MTFNISDILTLDNIDLTPFEIRGAKSGVNNARTTGPVYVDGTYIPFNNIVYGTGTFTHDSSIVTDVFFYQPYTSVMDVFNLRSGDLLPSVDSTHIHFPTAPAKVQTIDSTSAFKLNQACTFDQTSLPPITTDMTFNLIARDYVVEPDIGTNTIDSPVHGTASFTPGSIVVTGSGTTWLSDLATNDFIQYNFYQVFFKIVSIIDDFTLHLTIPYSGPVPVVNGNYTAKKWKLGLTDIQYAKDDNIAYDKKKAMWTYDATKNSAIPAESYFAPLEYLSQTDSSGIFLQFTPSLSSTAPDIMDTAVVQNQVFSQKTQYDTFQFSLPKVPVPEDSMELYIDNVKKDMYPNGNQNYVLNYTQNPIYSPPPPLADRQVCNVMFLGGINNVTIPTSVSETGQFRFVDAAGNSISEILAGSERMTVNGVDQTRYYDYMIDQYSGMIEVTDSTVREPIVKYVNADYASMIDYGFAVYLDGQKQKISFPSQTSDDILFQPLSGRLKPTDQDHPGPDQTYEIHYMTEATAVSNEQHPTTTGQTEISTNLYPVKQQSLLVFKNGDILTENSDYYVSYLSGRVVFVEPLTVTSNVVFNYSPLSKQINGLSYADNAWQCTVFDSRLTVTDASSFSFSLTNVRLNPSDATYLRVYNETRDGDYNLTGMVVSNTGIKLAKDSTNISIGLAQTDIVLVDYAFQNETTEYSPVIINYLNVNADTTSFYIEGPDLTQYMSNGSIVNLGIPRTATQYFFQANGTYDGFGTLIQTATPIPQSITNPSMLITDASVSFVPLSTSMPATSIVSGSMNVSFPANIRNIFRPETLLKIHDDLYQVSTASYTRSNTVVTLTAEALRDYTTASDLAGILCSDCPVYSTGTTEVFPRENVVSLFKQPAFIMSGHNAMTVVTDSSGMTIDGSTFSYVDYPTLGDLFSVIDTSVAVTMPAPTDWQSNKIVPTSIEIYPDSSSVFSASPTLWYMDNTDSTNYSISTIGSVVLTNPLQRYDRYDFDYMGQKFLDDSTVEYSARYFVVLPKNSNVRASFQYKNLDQFYIQVLSQKDFLQNVSIPRLQQEAYQLSDNPGQGGTVYVDSDPQPSDGGIANSVYNQRDAQIECRVFKSVYDFFSDRIQAYSDEVYAFQGYRMFNVDGTFSEDQQTGATKAVSRIFPFPDYTGNDPVQVNPLTGYFFDTGAIFKKGLTDVTSTGSTRWKTYNQLEKNGYIGRASSAQVYKIQTVVSDSSLVLQNIFSEPTTSNFQDGEKYTATSLFPRYDDDGNMGAKIIGTRSGGFGLSDDDDFTCIIDGVPGGCTFRDPFPPFLTVSGFSTDQIISVLQTIPGLKVTSETVLDPTQTFGYRTALVLRTIPPYNSLSIPNVIGQQLAVPKLGFSVGADSTGNLNRSPFSEYVADQQEKSFLNDQLTQISILEGLTNKLDRSSTYQPQAMQVLSDAYAEIVTINEETSAISAGTTALQSLMNGSLAGGTPVSEYTVSYGHVSTDFTNASAMLVRDTSAYSSDLNFISSWPGPWQWALDFGVQISRSVDVTAGPNLYQIPNDVNDWRLLNTNLDGFCLPYIDALGGTWTNTDSSTPLGNYSENYKVTYTAPPATISGQYTWVYYTISDRQMNARASFDTARIGELTTRLSQLNLQYANDKTALTADNILLASNGQPGDLYNWANNRFNRRQGCEARLNQINQQIASNQSALNINKSFIS